MTGPLVSIGIPTYNRLDELRRTIASARRQTYTNLEILISDNTSTDGTEAFCTQVAAEDARIDYRRMETNIGPTANFGAVRDRAHGEFFMWLADDDWLDDDYVERCLAELMQDPSLVLVAGEARQYLNDQYVSTGVVVQADGPRPADRVLAYYRQVLDNGTFYGLMHNSGATARTFSGTRMGSDWLLLAEFAVAGGIRTLPTTHIHRSLGAADRTFADMATVGGLSWFEGHFAYVVIAWYVLYDTAFATPAFRALGWRRFVLAVRASAVIARRFLITGLRWSSLRRRGRSLADRMRTRR